MKKTVRAKKLSKKDKVIRSLAVSLVVLLLFFSWGYVGGQQTKYLGVTCDIGEDGALCWKWHKTQIYHATKLIKEFIEE